MQQHENRRRCTRFSYGVVVVVLLTASSLRHSNQWMKTLSSKITISTVEKTGLSFSEDDAAASKRRRRSLNWDVCLERANERLQNWTDYWYSQRYPIFAAATVAPPRSGYSATTFRNQTWMYHLSFTTNRAVGKVQEIKLLRRVFQKRHGPPWYCVDQNKTRVKAQVPRPFSARGHILTIVCPTNMELDQIQVDLDPKWAIFSYPPVLSYRVQPHAHCARQRIGTSPPTTRHDAAPHIVACTLIKGNVPRTLLPQWIEYHRMIGIERFVVYLHEPYQSGLPNLPYVEYIPFDVEGPVVVQKAKFLFQLAQQNDCLMRSRAMGSKWVVTHDVDEYIQIMGQNDSVSLWSILEQALVANPTMGALLLTEAHFGHKLQEKDDQDDDGGNVSAIEIPLYYYNNASRFMMDHVYRGDYIEGGGGKVIMRPENVRYTDVHQVSSGGSNQRMDPGIVRLNHYNRPHLVRRKRSKDGVQNFVILDTSLRDAFRTRLSARMEQLRAKNGNRS